MPQLRVLARVGGRSGGTFTLTGTLDVEKLPEPRDMIDIGGKECITISDQGIETDTDGQPLAKVNVEQKTFTQLRQIGFVDA